VATSGERLTVRCQAALTLSSSSKVSATGLLIADIEVQVDDDPAAGLFSPVKLIVKIPIGNTRRSHQISVNRRNSE